MFVKITTYEYTLITDGILCVIIPIKPTCLLTPESTFISPNLNLSNYTANELPDLSELYSPSELSNLLSSHNIYVAALSRMYFISTTADDNNRKIDPEEFKTRKFNLFAVIHRVNNTLMNGVLYKNQVFGSGNVETFINVIDKNIRLEFTNKNGYICGSNIADKMYKILIREGNPIICCNTAKTNIKLTY